MRAFVIAPLPRIFTLSFEEMKPAATSVLILNAVVKLWKKSVVDWKTFLIFLLVFAGSVFLNISPVLYVLAAAVAGIVIRELEARKA